MGWKEQCKYFKMNKENIAIWSGKGSVKQREHSNMGWKNQCKQFKTKKENIAIWGGKISVSSLKPRKRI